jgi:hypothetical protein
MQRKIDNSNETNEKKVETYSEKETEKKDDIQTEAN